VNVVLNRMLAGVPALAALVSIPLPACAQTLEPLPLLMGDDSGRIFLGLIFGTLLGLFLSYLLASARLVSRNTGDVLAVTVCAAAFGILLFAAFGGLEFSVYAGIIAWLLGLLWTWNERWRRRFMKSRSPAIRQIGWVLGVLTDIVLIVGAVLQGIVGVISLGAGASRFVGLGGIVRGGGGDFGGGGASGSW
jgi:uncharacterized membrane protein YgcG